MSKEWLGETTGETQPSGETKSASIL